MDPAGRPPLKFCVAEKMKLWTDTYAPKSLLGIVGQDLALTKLKGVVEQKGIALLYGPTGVGKTASIYALASDLGYEVLELNASDFRDGERIHSIIGHSLHQASLFNKGKIVLVDELDGISGSEDRGGLNELNSLIETRQHALILIANHPWDKKFAAVRKKSMLIEYKPVRAESVARVLKSICNTEGLHYLEEDLKTLGRKSGGDVRAAINDLQVLCAGSNEMCKDDFSFLGEREQDENVFTALRVILKGKDAQQALGILDNVDADLDEMMLWLDENLGREYRGKDLVRGYDMLGKADVFRGRIRKWQYWRFLVYVRVLMSAGVSVAKERAYHGYTPYARHGRILKVWMANQKNARMKEIAKKIAAKTHVSSRDARKVIVPYVKRMYESGALLALPFSDEEIEWLRAQKQ